MRTCLALLFLLIMGCTSEGMAQSSPPVPESRKDALREIEDDLATKKQELKALEERSKALEEQMGETRSALVSVAGKVKNAESTLSALENEIQDTEKQKQALVDTLEADKGKVAALILALERIQRVPPEALILKPGAPYETAQSAMLLQSLLPQIYAKTESLRENTARLDEILVSLKEKRTTAANQKQALDKEYASMNSLLQKREKIFSQTNTSHKNRQAEITRISAQASTLKDLIARLEEDRIREKAREATRQAVIQTPPLPKSGEAQLPASGLITTNYGQADDIGATSQGIHLQTRTGALVVAPMGGKVQFSGPFKGYGKLIIIEHEKDYHSLIAGMDKVDIVVEQVLKAGEPIGRMAKEYEDGEAPVLYYELRHKGSPVNPAKRINIKS